MTTKPTGGRLTAACSTWPCVQQGKGRVLAAPPGSLPAPAEAGRTEVVREASGLADHAVKGAAVVRACGHEGVCLLLTDPLEKLDHVAGLFVDGTNSTNAFV